MLRKWHKDNTAVATFVRYAGNRERDVVLSTTCYVKGTRTIQPSPHLSGMPVIERDMIMISSTTCYVNVTDLIRTAYVPIIKLDAEV